MRSAPPSSQAFEIALTICSRVPPNSRVATAVRLGHVDPEQLLFARSAEQAQKFPAVLAEIRRLDELQRAAALHRSHVLPGPSESFAAWLRQLVHEGT